MLKSLLTKDRLDATVSKINDPRTQRTEIESKFLKFTTAQHPGYHSAQRRFARDYEFLKRLITAHSGFRIAVTKGDNPTRIFLSKRITQYCAYFYSVGVTKSVLNSIVDFFGKMVVLDPLLVESALPEEFRQLL